MAHARSGAGMCGTVVAPSPDDDWQVVSCGHSS